MVTQNDAERQFLVQMQSRDLQLADGKQLVADGQWHRCCATNKSGNNTDGAYKLYLDGPKPWGAIRNWTDGKSVEHWNGKASRALTESEQRDLNRRIEQALIEDAKRAAELAEQARATAQRIWYDAVPATAEHAYLTRKGVKPHGLRLSEYGRLLVPMYNADGELVNLQFIAKDGRKYFLRGGRLKGTYFRIPGSYDMIVEVEGFATGASIHAAVGCCVAIAFCASNLKDVAVMLRGMINNADAYVWTAHETQATEAGEVHAQRPRFINTKLIVGADDDWKTPNNPGVMDGLTAARAGKALIAIPQFAPEREAKQTDFNDVAQEQGLDAVKATITNAVEPSELLERLLLADPQAAHGDGMTKQLADLKQHDPVAYEKLLAQLKGKKVRIRPLEKKIKKVEELRTEHPDDTTTTDLYEHWSVEPWEQPVDTGELLQEITGQITRYVATLGNRAVAVGLWTMFAWVHDAATYSPILVATSAEPDCGKTTMLGVVGFMSRRALLSVDITSAALFRSLEKWKPTFIVDEAEEAFEKSRDMRDVVNSGWTRGQVVIRCHPETNEPYPYSTFAPKAIGTKGLGKLPDTTLSRSIIINLHRKSAAEKVEKFKHLDTPEFVIIRRKCLRWAADNMEALRAAQPTIPEGFRNRMEENWSLLLAIAELAGVAEEAQAAGLLIEGNDAVDKTTLGTKLLSDIRAVFGEAEREALLSRDLVSLLTADPEKPWAEYKNGKPLSQRQLSNLLADFGIRSEEVHPEDGPHGKGYKRVRFADAFARYLIDLAPEPAFDPRSRANTHGSSTSSAFRSAQNPRRARIENDELPYSRNGLRGSADRNGVNAPNKEKTRKDAPASASKYRPRTINAEGLFDVNGDPTRRDSKRVGKPSRYSSDN